MDPFGTGAYELASGFVSGFGSKLEEMGVGLWDGLKALCTTPVDETLDAIASFAKELACNILDGDGRALLEGMGLTATLKLYDLQQSGKFDQLDDETKGELLGAAAAEVTVAVAGSAIGGGGAAFGAVKIADKLGDLANGLKRAS